MGFTAPGDLGPYKPDKNTCTIVLKTSSPITNVDQYQVTPTDTPPTPPFQQAVTHGTPLTDAQRLCAAELAWEKFKKATCNPNPPDAVTAQAALISFENNLGRPFYGL
jgi:hypothetical protein